MLKVYCGKKLIKTDEKFIIELNADYFICEFEKLTELNPSREYKFVFELQSIRTQIDTISKSIEYTPRFIFRLPELNTGLHPTSVKADKDCFLFSFGKRNAFKDVYINKYYIGFTNSKGIYRPDYI